MVNLRVYAFVHAGYFGFGLTPAAALFEAREAGCPAKVIKEGQITALPVGITKYWIGDMGGINWEFPKDHTAPREMYFNGDLSLYNREGNKWVLKVGKKEKDPGSLCLGYDSVWRWPEFKEAA